METMTEPMIDGHSLRRASSTPTLPTSFSNDHWIRLPGKHILNDKCYNQYSGEAIATRNTKPFNMDTRDTSDSARALQDGVKSLNRGSEKGGRNDECKQDFDRSANVNQNNSNKARGHTKLCEPIWANMGHNHKRIESARKGDVAMDMGDDGSPSSGRHNGIFRSLSVLCSIIFVILVIASIEYVLYPRST